MKRTHADNPGALYTCPGGHTPWRVLLARLSVLCLALCGLMLATPAIPTVHADGGAPNLAYVAGGAQGVSAIDIGLQKVIKTFPLGGNPAMIYLSLDGRYLYVAQPGLNKVTMLAARSGATVCSANVPGQPTLLAFDAGIDTLYAAGNGAASITALDAQNCAIKKTIATSSPVYGMATAEVGAGPNGGTGNQLWFTTSTAVNVYQQGKIQSISIPGGPQYVSIPSGATVYVTTRQGTVVAVSLQTLQATPPLLSGGDFGPMDFDAFTSEVYVPDKKHNQVDVLTPIPYGSSSIPHEPNHVIPLGVSPQSVAISSDGNLGFVALASGHVAMLDVPGKMLVNTIFVGGNPRFIITGLYPPGASSNASSTSTNNAPVPAALLYSIAAVALLLLLVIVLLIILARRKKV